MRTENIKYYCDPLTHDPLELVTTEPATGEKTQALVNPKNGHEYRIINNIIRFLQESELTGYNKKFRRFYNLVSKIYDFSVKFYTFFLKANEEKFRREYLDLLTIKNGDHVLEVSIGTGGNIPFLPAGASYFGLDLSIGMISKCRRNLKKWNHQVELALGEAENLPYKDNSFDCVYHMGAFNFFNDKTRAINEMIRVAKPGAKIMILDENEYTTKKFRNWPLLKKTIRKHELELQPPTGLIPKNMKNIETTNMKISPLWCITFTKP
jgi:ubiquinone/menaquinone biosynthesis C-methylase UbiE